MDPLFCLFFRSLSDVYKRQFVYSWKRVCDPVVAAPYAETVLGMVKGFDEAQAGDCLLYTSEEGICSVVVTIKVPIQLVSRCFLMIRPSLAPRALAAIT